jgi:hypothetical protein
MALCHDEYQPWRLKRFSKTDAGDREGATELAPVCSLCARESV